MVKRWWLVMLAVAAVVWPPPCRAGYLPEVVTGQTVGASGEVHVDGRPALRVAVPPGQTGRLDTVVNKLQVVLGRQEAPPTATFGKAPGTLLDALLVNGEPVLTLTPADQALWPGPRRRSQQQMLNTLNAALSALPSLEMLPGTVQLPVHEKRTFPLLSPEEGGLVLSALLEEGRDALTMDLTRGGTLFLEGLAPGQSSLLVQKGMLRRRIPVVVRHVAGTMTGPMMLFLSQPPPPERELTTMAQGAITAHLFARAGAETTLTFSMSAPTAAGRWTTPVDVRIQGPGYFDLSVSTTLDILVGPFLTLAPRKLYMSNSPERVKAPGRLFETPIIPHTPVRFMLHHLNDSPDPQVYYVKAFNPGRKTVALYLQGGSGGPSPFEGFTGFVAGLGFLEGLYGNTGSGLTIPPGGQAVLLRRRAKPKDVVSAIQNLEAVGGDLMLMVDAYSEDPQGREVMPRDKAHPELVFSYTTMEQKVSHKASQAWKYLPLGHLPASAGANQHHIKGNFGGMDQVEVAFENDDDIPRKVWIKFFPAAGYAGGLFFVDREIVSIEPIGPPKEVTIYRQVLKPGEKAQVRVESLTLPGSNYPAKLIVAAEPRQGVANNNHD